ncbi:unnamed protein product, partial [Polarella glacialis]
TVPTAAVERLKGADAVKVRGDRCSGLDAEVLRAFCGKCYSALATFPRTGDFVQVTAGCLEAETLPEVSEFVSRCPESAPPFLGFIPEKKKKKASRSGGAQVTGGCSCGSCRYAIRKLPEEFQHCYCGQCRRLSGAAWQTWMPVEDGHFSWTKKDGLKLVRTTTHARRHVCTHCGVFLTIVYDEDGATWPLAGSLDDAWF